MFRFGSVRRLRPKTEPSRAPGGWGDRLARLLLLGLPVSTVAVVGIAIFVVGAPRSYRAARVWGGATTAQTTLSFRVQVFDRLAELERPVASVPVDMLVSYGGRSVRWNGSSDSAGFADPVVELATQDTGAVHIELEGHGHALASGNVRLSLADWRRGIKRQGGWTRGRRTKPFRIRVRPGRGVFAVPFADPLVVQVSDSKGPVVGALVALHPEGARILPSADPVVTDARGVASVLLSPSEHHPTLGIDVSFEGRRGQWHSTLPVVPGALHARLEGDELLLQSAVARDWAYYSIVSDQGRLRGGRVALVGDGRGGAAARLPFSVQIKRPLWAVVSSDPDLRAPATVGWPLTLDVDDALTFDVYDRLLLDGAPQAYARSQRVYRHARWLAGGYALVSLALVLVLLLVRVRTADARLARHLASESASDKRPPAALRFGLTFVVAVLCVSLGFLLVLLVALYRIGVP